ncbi:MAG: 30S ribosomal protein S16 [Planctomycetes bacterium]|nr:30S ribosomal protein S16 [Planctomycetota bacterium]
MAVVIRLRRTGRKNLPCFRITATDSRFPRDGRSLETLGLYDPLKKDPAQQLRLNEERTRWWLEHGALPSDIVQSLFKRLAVFPRKPKEKRERPGRKPNASTARRRAAKQARTAAKASRFQARRAAKKAAAGAAKE